MANPYDKVRTKPNKRHRIPGEMGEGGPPAPERQEEEQRKRGAPKPWQQPDLQKKHRDFSRGRYDFPEGQDAYGNPKPFGRPLPAYESDPNAPDPVDLDELLPPQSEPAPAPSAFETFSSHAARTPIPGGVPGARQLLDNVVRGARRGMDKPPPVDPARLGETEPLGESEVELDPLGEQWYIDERRGERGNESAARPARVRDSTYESGDTRLFPQGEYVVKGDPHHYEFSPEGDLTIIDAKGKRSPVPYGSPDHDGAVAYLRQAHQQMYDDQKPKGYVRNLAEE